MPIVIVCAIIAIWLIWTLIRATKPKMLVVVETREYEEEDSSGQRRKVSSVSASYDLLDHQLEVNEWRHDLKTIGLIVALVVVVTIGIVAFNRIH